MTGFRQSWTALRSVAANRALRRLELSWTGSTAGEFSFSVAISVYAYREGGAAAVGLVWLLRMLPAAAGAPFAAMLGDRYRRELVMLWANVVRASATAATAAAVALDAPAAPVYALAVVVALLSTIFWPAQAALLPALARTPAELTAANTASTTLEGLGTFTGPALCGALLALTSVEAAFAATALVFLAGALPLAGIRAPAPMSAGANVVAELVGGFRAVAGDRALAVLVAAYGVWALATGALNVLVVVAAIELLGLGEGGVGLLNAAIGVGGIAGAVAALALVSERRLARTLVLGGLVWSLPIALLGGVPEPAAALVLLAILGIGNILLDVSLLTLIQRAAPAEVLSRVLGIVEGLWVGAIGLGAVAVPALIEAGGTRIALVVAGLVLPAFVLVARRAVAGLDAPAGVPLLRAVPFLSLLAEPALERLAARLESFRVPAGAQVVVEGEVGDRFYVVVGGELAVSTGRRLGPGDCFGEIALLRDVLRTATVTALTDAELVALGREDFLEAVTGRARAAADAFVAKRLAPARS